MTKQEMEDKYFRDFLVWCTYAPDGKNSELVFWLDHHFPTQDNFWEWLVHKEILKDNV
jgi:hypothetical protein